MSLDDKLERQTWIDVAKAIAIVLIVFGHFGGPYFIHCLLWTFHVPLFFFLSGYLNHTRNISQLSSRLLKRLVVPYFTVYAVLTLIKVRSLDWNAIGQTLLASLWGTHSNPYFVYAPLWFLPSLLTIEILFWFILRTRWWAYPILITISLILFTHGKINLFMSVDLSLLGLNYFVAGVICRQLRITDYIAKRPEIGVLLVAIGLANTIDAAIAGNVWYSGSSYTRTLLNGITGIAMVVGFSISVKQTAFASGRVIRFLSENTLFILCFHGLSYSTAQRAVQYIGLSPAMIVSLFLETIISISILVPPCLLTRWLVPWAIGVRRTPAARKTDTPPIVPALIQN